MGIATLGYTGYLYYNNKGTVITVVHPKSGEFPFDYHNHREIGNSRRPKFDPGKGGPEWYVGVAIVEMTVVYLIYSYFKNTNKPVPQEKTKQVLKNHRINNL